VKIDRLVWTCENFFVYEEKKYHENRVENCPYGDGKPVCKDCQTHCYSTDMRDMVKKVMRYSGPRMILHSPSLTIAHMILSVIAKPKKQG
jgi:hypothetical protein